MSTCVHSSLLLTKRLDSNKEVLPSSLEFVWSWTYVKPSSGGVTHPKTAQTPSYLYTLFEEVHACVLRDRRCCIFFFVSYTPAMGKYTCYKNSFISSHKILSWKSPNFGVLYLTASSPSGVFCVSNGETSSKTSQALRNQKFWVLRLK